MKRGAHPHRVRSDIPGRDRAPGTAFSPEVLLKRAIVAILAALGGFVILAFLFLIAMSWALLSPTPVPSSVVLELDLREGIVETVPEDPFLMAFGSRRLRVHDVVEGLEVAASDRRVAGLLVRGDGAVGGWAGTEELRDAVLRFRESGKPAVLFAETFGEFGAGQAGYFLGSAFDEIVLQPSGEVGLLPLVADVPFFAEALDKLDVEARFDTRWEYKDAAEILNRTEFSPPAREAMEALLESILGTLVDAVAEARQMPSDSVRALVRAGPFLARPALEAGLVDRLGYLDEARDRVRELTDADAEQLSFRDWNERRRGGWTRGPRVALVHGVGAIQRGRGGFDPLSGTVSLGAEVIAENLRSAIDDDRVQAILFRVDSPGGSWPGSDQVRRELQRARDAGKPVVVSMGNAAASGGYLISAPADRIVAHPTTITGSIGVVAGRFVTRGLWDRLGVDWDRVSAGGEMSYFSGVDDFTDEEWERFQESIDHIYGEFVRHVAEGRSMDRSAVEEVARGRVWSGRDAHAVGLVDALGGYSTALDEIRTLLDLEPDAPLQVATYPPERTFVQLLLDDGFRVAIRGGGPQLQGGTVEQLRQLLGRAGALGLLGEHPGPVRMPYLEIPAL
jgi:protease IV